MNLGPPIPQDANFENWPNFSLLDQTNVTWNCVLVFIVRTKFKWELDEEMTKWMKYCKFLD